MSRYWLNPKIDDPVQHEAERVAVCAVYQHALALKAEGVRVVCVDEKTGIQALERAAPTLSMQPGLDERREFEYIRHGTTCLTANFEVATGEILAPTIEPTRDEQDFARHIGRTIDIDPAARWIFVLDHLSTHTTEALVRLVAEHEGIDDDLGKKRKHGVLRDVASRTAFLTDSARKIRFVYTPKHCSWLNQVEIWFSVLTRSLLKRASFTSIADATRAIRKFIAYYNRVHAKPYRWTYTGRALAA
jgi:transposase